MYFKEEGFVDLNEIKKKVKVAAFENEFEMVGREIPSVWFEGDYNQRNSFINTMRYNTFPLFQHWFSN